MTYPTIMPAITLDFQNSQQLDPRVTFSRASSATYINSAGQVASAADHEARFDHDPVTGECQGLLLEESRTNLVTYSEEFDQWNAGSNATITPNAAIAPDGSMTADLITGSLPSADVVLTGLSTSNTESYTASIYVKAGDDTTGALRAGGDGNYIEIQFNLSTETFTLSDGGNSAVISGDLQSVGNGWYRVIVSGSAVGYTTSSNVLTSGRLYIWGAQLEQGSFSSSYIPTSGSTATRSQDIAQVTTADIYGDEFTIINKPFGVSSGSDTLHIQGHPHVERAAVYNENLSQEQINTVAGVDEFWRWRILGSSFALSSFQTDGQVTVDWGDGTVETLTQSTHTFSNGSGYHYVGFRLDSGTYFQPRVWNNSSHDQKLISTGPVPNSMKVSCDRAFYGCTNLESIDPSLNLTGANPNGIVNSCTNLKNFPLSDFSIATDMGGHLGGGNRGGWNGCSSITSFPAIDFPLITSLWLGWSNCSSMRTFNATWGSGVTNMQQTFQNCSSLEAMPFRQTQNVTNFSSTWQSCSSLSSFALLDTSSGTNFSKAWRNCSSLSSFPLLDTSSGTNFFGTWRATGIVSFPLLDVSSSGNFNQAWLDCTSLVNFPANFFDNIATPSNSAFLNSWDGCSSLSATSVENILNSIDASGHSAPSSSVEIIIDYDAATGTPNITTAVTNLKSRGWTIRLNNVFQ